MIQADRFYTGCPALFLTCRGRCAHPNVFRVATPESDNPVPLWLDTEGRWPLCSTSHSTEAEE